MKEGKLFDLGYGHKQRLKDILEKKIHPNRDDILELWTVFRDGCINWAGVKPDLVDFGMWISGTGSWGPKTEFGGGACEVTW